MPRLLILDSNAISDCVNGRADVLKRFYESLAADDQCCICHPIYYELLRGLYQVQATRKLRILRQTIFPLLHWKAIEKVTGAEPQSCGSVRQSIVISYRT